MVTLSDWEPGKVVNLSTPSSVHVGCHKKSSPDEVLRAIAVIPKGVSGASMIFAERQVESLQRCGVKIKPFYLSSRTSPLTLVREVLRFRREIQTFKPDLIHAHFGTMTAFFCAASTRLPLVVTYRGSDLNPSPDTTSLRSAAGRFLSQIAALRARRIICVSPQLKERLWWKRSCASVIPTGVDTTIFYPRSRDEARSELGWGTEELVVLFNAGRNPKVKRLDLAQASIEVAKAVCGEIRFVVLDGYVDPKLIPTMMNAADCLLLTSDWEGSPTVVQEALACNLPVVSVDVGDVRERLTGVKPSRIVERDPRKIGEAVAEVLMKRERSNGYETIQELALDRLASRILSIYREALRG